MSEGQDGIVVLDKPPGITSHDAVARVRRLARTRRVGHAGTLDPMATGVLLLGVGRATRLLGYLARRDKAYDATIRFGQSTTTDDAEGAVAADVSAADVTADMIAAAAQTFTGDLLQVPSTVSAIRVGGRRSYALARSGEAVELQPRPVTVYSFDVVEIRRNGSLVDVDVSVVCSTGTYVRALARDLGRALGVGGHLTWLRRTRVGPYDLTHACTLDDLAAHFAVTPLPEAVQAAFPRRDVGVEEARQVRHGGRLEPGGTPGPVGVFGPDGTLLALMEDADDAARPLAVFTG